MQTRFIATYAGVSLVIMTILGVVLGNDFGYRVAARARASTVADVALASRVLVEPQLSAADAERGLRPALLAALTHTFRTAAATSTIKNVLIWNHSGDLLFSAYAPSDADRPNVQARQRALRGERNATVIRSVGPIGSGQAGRYLETYVPVRSAATGGGAVGTRTATGNGGSGNAGTRTVAGARTATGTGGSGNGGSGGSDAIGAKPTVIAAFQAYVDYRPVDRAVRSDQRRIMAGVLVALFLLWLALFRLVSKVSQRVRETTAENATLSKRDSLTGLPNRAMLDSVARLAIAKSLKARKLVALILVDLDRFKEINDTLGHPLGDQLLTMIGPRLSEVLREHDLIARVGGDEFVILLTELSSSEEADWVAQRAVDALHAPFVVDGLPLVVEASFGVVVAPDHGTTFDELFQKADVAMYRAKARHGGIQHYDPAFDRRSVDRLAMLAELQHAIEADELVLYYQPKLDIATSRFTSVEALVRWPHPTRGLVPPNDFIPQAEGSGLIRPLTNLVMRKGFAQVAAWAADGIDVHISINVSARNLLDPSLCEEVRVALRRASVDPSKVTLEITETAVMIDPERAIEILRELAAMGLGLSVDDFGVGHSSMAYLKRLPVTELKIDQSFVGSVINSAVDTAIVRTTVELGRALGLGIVAEGVETAAVLGRLAELGCTAAQGYYLSRPLPAAQMEHLLRVPFAVAR